MKGISEANALFSCQNSFSVVQFIEKFTYLDKTYIVTKLAQGGNLNDYLEHLGTTHLSEEQARVIFGKIAAGV